MRQPNWLVTDRSTILPSMMRSSGPWPTAASRPGLVLSLGLLAAALAWLPLPVLGLGLAGLGALTVLRWPVLGLCLAAIAVPFGSLAPLPLGGGALTLAPVALAGSGLAWGLAGLARGRLPLPELPRGLRVALGLFGLALAAAAWQAPEARAAFFELARWLMLSLALLLAAALAGRPRQQRVLLGALLAAGAGQALLGGWMALERIGPEAFLALGGRITRAHGSFGQPNPFAGYMNMVWPLGAALLLTALSGREPGSRPDRGAGSMLALLGGATASICGLALILSWSRGGWLAAAAAATALGLLWLARGLGRPALRQRAAWLAWLGALLLVSSLWAGALERLPAGIQARLASIGQSERLWGVADAEVTDASFSTIERIAHWEAAASMWAERPWLGQGPGHYELSYARHRLPRWPDALGHAHNVYLNFLAEIGLIGLIGFLLLWLALARLALRAALRPTSPLEAALGLGLAGVLAATTVHNLLDNLFVHEMTLHLGLLAGLTLAAGARHGPARPDRRPMHLAHPDGPR